MRALIISYYYPPCNGVPASRVASIARVLRERGHEVTVVTRHWSGEEHEWTDYLASTTVRRPAVRSEDGITIHCLPYDAHRYSSNAVLRKFTSFLRILRGHFSVEVDTTQFGPYVENLLREERFDWVLTSSPPLNLVRLGAEVTEDHAVSWHADFRDYQNDVLLRRKGHPGLIRRWMFARVEAHVRRWLDAADGVSAVTPPILEHLAPHVDGHSLLATNGYESELIRKTVDVEPPTDRFTMTVLGTLYPAQELEPMFEGMDTLVRQVPRHRLRFRFVGTAGIAEIADRIRARVPSECLDLTPRVPKLEAMRAGRRSHVLFYAGWPDHVGIYSGKIFDYIALARRILIAPGDGGVIDDLVERTRTGVSVPDGRSCGLQLLEWYEEWSTTGSLPCQGDQEVIRAYSRENQSAIIARALEAGADGR